MVEQMKNSYLDRTDVTSLQRNEMGRLCSLAQTHYEDAAMWAVKAATA